MKRLVINLDRSADRWDRFLTVNSAYLDDIHRINAVDGRLLTDKWRYLSRWMHLTHEPNKFNIMPAIGCFLSHRKAWQYVVDEHLPYALVLEDDAILTNRTAEFLEAYEANPPPIDWIKLHVHRRISRTKQEMIDLKISGLELCVDMAGSKSNAAYIINYAGAQKALAIEKLLAPVDHVEWLHVLHSLVFAQTSKNVVEVDGALESSITGHAGHSLRRIPNIMRIGLVRHTIGSMALASNLRAAKQAVRQHQNNERGT